MKKDLILFVILSMLLLTSCGASSNNTVSSVPELSDAESSFNAENGSISDFSEFSETESFEESTEESVEEPPEESIEEPSEESSEEVPVEESSEEPALSDEELIEATISRLEGEYYYIAQFNGMLFCHDDDMFCDVLYPDGTNSGLPRFKISGYIYGAFKGFGGVVETEDGSLMRLEFNAYKEFRITPFSDEKNEENKKKYLERIIEVYNEFHECVSKRDFDGIKQYVSADLYEALLKHRDSDGYESCDDGYCIAEYFSVVTESKYPEYVTLQKMTFPRLNIQSYDPVRTALSNDMIVDDSPGGHSQLFFSFEYYGDDPYLYWTTSPEEGSDNGVSWYFDFVCDGDGNFLLDRLKYYFH